MRPRQQPKIGYTQSAQYQKQSRPLVPFAWWDFRNEGSYNFLSGVNINTVADLSGNGNTLSGTGSRPTFVAGEGAKFVAASSQALYNTPSPADRWTFLHNLTATSGSPTIEATVISLFKIDAAGGSAPIWSTMNQGSDVAFGARLRYEDTTSEKKLRFLIGNSASKAVEYLTNTNTYTIGNWILVSTRKMVRPANYSDAFMYVNGPMTHQAGIANAYANGNIGNLWIGRDNGGTPVYADMTVAEIQIYDRALTHKQLADIERDILTRAGLIGQYTPRTKAPCIISSGQSNQKGDDLTSNCTYVTNGQVLTKSQIFNNTSVAYENITIGTNHQTGLADSPTQIGPLVGIAQFLGQNTAANVVPLIIPYAEAGVPITYFLGSSAFYGKVQNALWKAEELGYDPVVLFDWWQGENEAASATGSARYANDFKNLLYALQNNIANYELTGVMSTKIKRNAVDYTYSDTVNAALKNLSTAYFDIPTTFQYNNDGTDNVHVQANTSYDMGVAKGRYVKQLLGI